MALSSDPEKKRRQLANLAKSNPKLAARLEAGDIPEPPAARAPRPRQPVVRDAPPAPAPAPRKRQRSQPRREDDGGRPEPRDDAPKRGGFFAGLFDW